MMTMRAHLEINEQVLKAAEREAARRGQTLSALVESALSAFVPQVPRREKKALPTFRGQGLQPGVNLDDSASLLELMEPPHAPD